MHLPKSAHNCVCWLLAGLMTVNGFGGGLLIAQDAAAEAVPEAAPLDVPPSPEALPAPAAESAVGTLPVRMTSLGQPTKDAVVSVVLGGRVITEAPAGESGVAQIGGLSEGVFSFMAHGRAGFAAFSAYYDPTEDREILAGLIPMVDMPPVRELIRTKLLATPISAKNTQAVEENLEESLSSDQEFVNQAGLGDDVLDTGTFDLIEGTARGIVVRVAKKGLPPSPIPGMEVLLVQNGSVVGRAETGPDGLFEIGNLRAGYHSLVVGGRTGFVGLGVNLVEGNVSARLGRPAVISFVSTNLAGGPTAVGAVPPSDFGAIASYAGVQPGGNGVGGEGMAGPGGPGMGPEGFGGGPGGFGGGPGAGLGAGGGGGFGVGGGLLPLLAAAGIAAGVAAGIDDGNDKNNTPGAP